MTLLADRALGRAPIFTWQHTVPAGDFIVRVDGVNTPLQSIGAQTGFGYNATEGPFGDFALAPEGAADPYEAFLDGVLDAVGEPTGTGRLYWEFDPEAAFPRPVYVWPDGLGASIQPGDGVDVDAGLAEALGLKDTGINEFTPLTAASPLPALRASKAPPGYWCPATRYASITPQQQRVGTVRAAALGTEVGVLTWRKNDRLDFDLPDVPMARVWQIARDDEVFVEGVIGEGVGTRHNLFERMLEHAAGEASTDPVIRVYMWDRIASTTGIKVCRWDEALEDTRRYVRQSGGIPSDRDISFSLRVVDTIDTGGS